MIGVALLAEFVEIDDAAEQEGDGFEALRRHGVAGFEFFRHRTRQNVKQQPNEQWKQKTPILFRKISFIR